MLCVLEGIFSIGIIGVFIFLRFEIENVEEPHSAPSHDIHTENMADITISTLGYNTAEVVPMTVYYRKDGEGNTRPTLENLRQGKAEKPTEEQLQVYEGILFVFTCVTVRDCM